MIGHWKRALALAIVVGWGCALLRELPAAQPSEIDAPPAARAGTRVETDHARTRAAIGEVLARPEFADLHSDPHSMWLRVIRWIEALFDAIASTLQHLPEWLLWTILAWMFLALAALLGHLVYTLWRLLSGSAQTSARDFPLGRHPGEMLGIRDLEFEPVYAEANRLLAAGEWLAATKYLYVAAILGLDRRRWITFRPAKTNRDYFGELRAEAQRQILFGRLTDCFEFIVYGGRSATMSTSHDMANIVEGLLHEPARAIAS
jgi:hypothetical protein